MQVRTGRIYEFDDFQLDADERRLVRNGETVPLHGKAMEMLLVLVRNRGRLLTKDELFEMVWPDQIVEESNLTVNMSAIRRALGERASSSHYITTVSGRGYRFTDAVREMDAEEETELVMEQHTAAHIVIEKATIENGSSDAETAGRSFRFLVPSSNAKGLTAGKLPKRKITLFLAGLALFSLLGFGGYRYFSPAPKNQIKSIAILPFKPLVVENGNESLEIGIADTLITKLSNLREINVRPISAVRKYAELDQDAAAAGREQNVDAVLDGQIQQSGEKIRITVRFIRTEDGTLIWTNQFDEKWTDIFAVQDSISERVAGALALKLTGEQKSRITKHHTEDTDAYQLYLLGRFHHSKRTREAVNKSVGYFNQAIEKDPNYALAYAGLGAAYSTSGWYDFLPSHEAYSKAKDATGKALQMDDTLAEARAVLANIKQSYDWDLAGAESEFKRALELDPNNSTAHQWYGLTLALMGRHDEAIAELKRAQQLDPLSSIINSTLAGALFMARRLDEAIAQFHKALELDPNNPYAHLHLGECYFYKNLNDEAVAVRIKGAMLLGASSQDIEALQTAYKRLGMKGFWRESAEQTKRSKVSISSYDVALYYSAAGDKEQALDWLEKAYRERSSGMIAIKADPLFDNIRSEPRFIELMRRVGLSQ